MNLKTLNLVEFLNYKTMYYDKIDFSYVQKSWKILSAHINIPYVIHIVGTNGKGSTGRYLSSYLNQIDKKVLHYSSPHIKNFNERIWINGNDVSDTILESAHKFLLSIYDDELLKILTYFEYTTLLALYLSKDVEYLVLEAGLGGEFDATNIIRNDLSLITTIDLDHQAFLGNTVKAIATTKMRSVDTKMLLGYQVHSCVKDMAYEVKKQIQNERNTNIEIKVIEEFDKYDFSNKIPKYLQRNLHLVIECLNELALPIQIELFDNVKLQGRCQKIASNITIDVGHNPLAAKVIYEEFKDKKVTLIYNSYKDKDFKEVLNILKPIIDDMYIIEVNDERIASKSDIQSIVKDLNIKELKDLDKTSFDDKKEYLVFGSFMVVEKFLDDLDYTL